MFSPNPETITHYLFVKDFVYAAKFKPSFQVFNKCRSAIL